LQKVDDLTYWINESREEDKKKKNSEYIAMKRKRLAERAKRNENDFSNQNQLMQIQADQGKQIEMMQDNFRNLKKCLKSITIKQN
jgi:uncharacterized membrane protein